MQSISSGLCFVEAYRELLRTEEITSRDVQHQHSERFVSTCSWLGERKSWMQLLRPDVTTVRLLWLSFLIVIANENGSYSKNKEIDCLDLAVWGFTIKER